MERHLRDASPRWALVVWPDIHTYAELPCCISLTDLDVAITEGAVVVGREDEEFCKARARVMPDPITLRLKFNHPYFGRPHRRSLDPPPERGSNTEGD